MQECKRKCDTDNPDPITKYNERNPTPSGWYITINGPFQGYGPSYEIKNKSLAIKISSDNDYPLYQHYLDMLEELPDPTKIYTTGSVSKNHWKLTYDSTQQLLKWENQPDQTKKPFVIASPLNIGDQTAR